MLRLALLAAAAASVSATAPGVRASISSHALKYIVVRRRRNCVAVSGRSPTPLLAAPAPAPATPPPAPQGHPSLTRPQDTALPVVQKKFSTISIPNVSPPVC